ncbi:MAG TPA: glycoside hydrolase family 76 protein [Longimicrobiaceae bacterium]|nr:glycoside hydrolase family 76 protein [Longimicrobiaceae bacterium]
MTETGPYLRYAQAAADVLTARWFGPDAPGRWVPNDFWRTPNVMTALNGLMTLTGGDAYQPTLDAGLAAYRRVYRPAYYDDEAWWGAAFLRIHARTGRDDYLDPVVGLFEDLRGGWDDTAGGGVWFKRSPRAYREGDEKNDKNSISTVLFCEVAGGLHATPRGTADQLEWAQRAWGWLREHLVDRWELLWGNTLEDGSINPDNPPRPYGQGVALGALTDLYRATGDARFIDAAVRLADAAVTSMTWNGGVLRDTYEVLGDFRPTLLDPILFKPIFARYLGEFTVALAGISGREADARRYAAFLKANADALWASYPGGVFGMDWHTPQPDYRPAQDADLYNGSLQSGAVDLFVAAARAASCCG